MIELIKTHPVQARRTDKGARCPVPVTLAAYEVYVKMYGEQPAMIEGNCRGGFGVGELIALLYAKSFPQNQWRQRFDEAIEGMAGL